MSSPRSKRLAGPLSVAAGGGGTLLYTCPDGKVALIKSIRIVNDGAGTANVRLRAVVNADTHLVLRGTPTAGSTLVDPDTDPIVLAAGESIWCLASITGCTFTLSGAELTA